MAVLSIRWQCLVLLGAAIVFGCVFAFTDMLDEEAIARYSVDGVKW